MIIAVPYQDGVIFEHFGHAKEFKIYSALDSEPITGEVVTVPDGDHETVAAFLKKQGVDVILCCNVGEGAKRAVEAEHMIIFSGISGGADERVQAFFDGNLDYGTDANCSGHEGGGCGGGCSGCHGGCHGCGEGEPVHSDYVETRTFTQIVTLTEENFGQEVLDDPGLILIDFWATWCQPCTMFAPTFEELNLEEPQVKFCRINVDEQPGLASMFGIDSIPTLAVVQDRHTLNGMVGAHSKADVKSLLDACR